MHETRYGSYDRTITLPTQVKADNAQASFANGVLHLTLPKAEGTALLRMVETSGLHAASCGDSMNYIGPAPMYARPW